MAPTKGLSSDNAYPMKEVTGSVIAQAVSIMEEISLTGVCLSTNVFVRVRIDILQSKKKQSVFSA